MKTINYTGSSKLISRIVHLLNRKAPMPLDANGDAVWGTNGQVLTTDGNGGTSWEDAGSGSGGHTIINPSGTPMAQEDGLQFVGFEVSDDAQNQKTVVENYFAVVNGELCQVYDDGQ